MPRASDNALQQVHRREDAKRAPRYLTLIAAALLLVASTARGQATVPVRGALGLVTETARMRVDLQQFAREETPTTPGGVPKIMHVNFLPNRTVLESFEMQPVSNFRRDWLRSCEVHNPGWTLMFWGLDEVRALLQDKYPEFLPMWESMPSVVLKSDAARIFILHAYGGVYLDTDTECFAPLENSIRDSTLVFPYEHKNHYVTNSQMATAKGHPFWKLMMKQVKQATEVQQFDPIHNGGPGASSWVLKIYLTQKDRVLENLDALLAGSYVDWTFKNPKTGADTQVMLYNVTKGWFIPCDWDDDTCHLEMARTKAIVRRLANGAEVDESALASSPATLDMVRTARKYAACTGAHHYSGSWTGWDGYDGSLHVRRTQQAIQGLNSFFNSPALFEEVDAWKQGVCGSSPKDQELREKHNLCAAALRGPPEGGQCTVLSIRGRVSEQLEGRQPDTSLEATLVQAPFNCKVHIVTLHGLKPNSYYPPGANVYSKGLKLGAMKDIYATPPQLHLRGIIETAMGPGPHNISLLHIDCGHDCQSWEVFTQLYMQDPTLLDTVSSLRVSFDLLPPAKAHWLYTLYQHLYQEHSFVGYGHRLASALSTSQRARMATHLATLQPMQLGFVKLSKLGLGKRRAAL